MKTLVSRIAKLENTNPGEERPPSGETEALIEWVTEKLFGKKQTAQQTRSPQTNQPPFVVLVDLVESGALDGHTARAEEERGAIAWED